MSDHLHEPDDDGDIVDQTEVDLAAGPSRTGPGAAPLLAEGAPPPGHPEASVPDQSTGEAISRGGVSPAGPTSTATGTGTGSGTGTEPDAADVPPDAPG